MMVMVSAFVVYSVGHQRRATIIKECTKVWPANSRKKEKKKDKENENLEEDYHGNFDAVKFEGLFTKLCAKLQEYGRCVIHMDGASYHKRRINPVPKSGERKDIMEKWLIDNGHLKLMSGQSKSCLPKKEL
jgi:hypothetical protein